MKQFNRYIAVVVSVLAPALSFAATSPYDDVTGAVDWTDAIAALGVVAAALAIALVAKKGFKIVLGMIR